MAYKESNMLPLGTTAPDFTLLDTVTDEEMSLRAISDGKKATVIMFICNHCPYVHHVNPEIAHVVADYKPRDVAFAGISANDIENYPQDRPELMKEVAAEVPYDFPYLYDATQQVAKAYDAACTPDFYVFDADLKLRYRGRMDDSRKGNNIPLSGRDLRAAIDAVIEGQPVSAVQYPSGGCNIKWKAD